MTTATQEAVAAEVARYSAALATVKASAEATVQGLWLSLDDWYDEALAAALAAQSAGVSITAQQAVIGATKQYVTAVVGILNGRRAPIPAVRTRPIRNGTHLPLVYLRAAEAYRRAIAFGADPQEALKQALNRAGGLVATDISLSAQLMQDGLMDALGVTTYRRVIRPELSESGSCGLCIAASNQIYYVGTLLPIHPPHCKCITLPIVDGNDPGRDLNEDDLKRLYDDAGGTSARALKRTRYKVNEHGELGPVIGKKSDNFRSQKNVPLEDDPERAARMLERILPTLESLEKRAAAGEDVSGPLMYQLGLVERLRRITGGP